MENIMSQNLVNWQGKQHESKSGELARKTSWVKIW